MKRETRRGFLSRLAFKQVAPESDHTLVCVFLRGGADTLNMIIPRQDDRYYKVRPTLSIRSASPSDKDEGLAIPVDDHYAFHPRMRPLVPIFKDGDLGIVQGVGSDNATGSHFEAQDQMEHGESSGQALNGGWLGRHMFLKSQQHGSKASPFSAVSLGASLPEALRGAPTACAIRTISDISLKVSDERAAAVQKALQSLYGEAAGDLGQAGAVTLDLLKRVASIKSQPYRVDGCASYPEDSFGRALKEVARLARSDLGLEVACVDLGGWDTHFFQGAAEGLQAERIDVLARGLSAFYKDTRSIADRVSVLVITEFGRRIYENSSMGTDHGRGFAVMAMGKRIAGGRVLGNLPHLTEEGEKIVGSSDLSARVEKNLPATEAARFLGPSGLSVRIDYRHVLAEVLAELLGNERIDRVFPGLDRQHVGLVA